MQALEPKKSGSGLAYLADQENTIFIWLDKNGELNTDCRWAEYLSALSGAADSQPRKAPKPINNIMWQKAAKLQQALVFIDKIGSNKIHENF